MPGFERREVEPRVAPVRPAELRLGDQPAQVRVSLRRLREQRHVRPVEQRQLRAGDRLQTERLRLLRERHRAVEAIVIGEGERRKPQLGGRRSEEHTSELQSPCNLVCRLLLEKKKKKITLLKCFRRRY